MAGLDDSQHSLKEPQYVVDISDFTQLTASQRNCGKRQSESDLDESQTCVMKLCAPVHERINVTPENVDRLFDEICRSPPLTEVV